MHSMQLHSISNAWGIGCDLLKNPAPTLTEFRQNRFDIINKQENRSYLAHLRIRFIWRHKPGSVKESKLCKADMQKNSYSMRSPLIFLSSSSTSSTFPFFTSLPADNADTCCLIHRSRSSWLLNCDFLPFFCDRTCSRFLLSPRVFWRAPWCCRLSFRAFTTWVIPVVIKHTWIHKK